MQHFMSYEKKTNSFNTSSSNTSNNNNNYNNNNGEDILKQFPKIKFSYESKPYKKVSQNKNNNSINESEQNKEFYFIIPKGKKYLVWFKNNECFFLELDVGGDKHPPTTPSVKGGGVGELRSLSAQRKIVSITKKNVSHTFPDNTILYGTYFYIRQPQQISNGKNGNTTYYFTIENIHYYNGLHLDTTNVFDKLTKINDFFKQQQQQQQQQQQLNLKNQYNTVEIGLPHISSSLKSASDIKPFYSAFCIQKKNYKNTLNEYENVFYFNSIFNCSSVVVPLAPHPPTHSCTTNTANKINTNNNTNSKYKIFTVRADLQNDVYHISNPDDNDVTVKSNEIVASIPDYKTSVMMNSLFRNIKENNSLDALEESDDEDEFENVNLDKFVDLSKKIKMKCIYNYKFKKWTPIAPINE